MRIDWFDIGRFCAKYGAKVYREGLCWIIEYPSGKTEHFLFRSALMNEVRCMLDKEKEV